MYSSMQLPRMLLIFSALVFGSMLCGLEALADNDAGGREYLKAGALVYVVQGSTGNFENTLLYLDGKNVEKLTANTHLSMAVTPGLHEISSAGTSRVALSLNAQAGNKYYIKLSINLSGLPQLAMLSELEGQQLVAQSRPVRNKTLVSNTAIFASANASANKDAHKSGPSPNQKSSGVYFGIGIGSAKAVGLSGEVEISVAILQDYADTFYGPGVFTATGSGDDSSLSGKLFMGYNFNKYLALEGFYTNFGEFKINASATDGVDTLNSVDSWKASGFGVSGLGMLPINNSISLFGKFGLIYWDMRYQWTLNDLVPPPIIFILSDSARGLSPLFGVGAKFDFSEQFGIRLEYERYLNIGKESATGQFDIDLISVSGVVRF